MTTTQRPELPAEKCAEYGALAYARKAPQDVAQYNPLGATDGQACANCLFFMSPNQCTVVDDWPVAISPTGRSRFWTAVPENKMEPMEVVIVGSGDDGGGDDDDDDKARKPGLFDRIMGAVKDVLAISANDRGNPSAPEPTGMSFYKDASGDLRWVAWVSNKFRDRDNPPEILEDKAHREFVAYLDKGGEMPEAWLWHTPGTRWGQADWADYADGFLLLSGTVDKGMEAVADALAKDGGLGVSHGFRHHGYSDEKNHSIGWYRTFEVSPLPREAAANPWTGMEVLRKEVKAMNPTKKAWLASKLGAEVADRLEQDTAGLSKALEAAGIDAKELPQDDPAPTITNNAASVKEITEALAPQFKALGDDIAGFKASTEQTLAGLDERLKAVERSEDEKIAEALKARVTPGSPGYRATTDPKTTLKDGDDDALKSSGPSWLTQVQSPIV